LAIDWLALLLHIREVPGTYFVPETNRLVSGFCGFLQSLQANARIMYFKDTAAFFHVLSNSGLLLPFDVT
jgi:hypothetical protein